MTREEAIKVASEMHGWLQTDREREALETFIPKLRESEDERIRKQLIDAIKIGRSNSGISFTEEAASRYIAWLEKQKEQKELPLMNDDADLYFDTWRQEVPVPTFRQCFEEGMRYAQRLQKEQKPINHNFTTFHRDVVYCAMCDKNLDEGLRCNLEIVYKIIKDIVDRTPVVEEQKSEWSEEDKRIRKDIINLIYWLKSNPSLCSQYYKDRYDSILTWLEKQSGCDIDCPQKHQDNSQPNGCIVLEDFNSGEGFYKLNLDYLNKEQVEEVEEMVRMWNKDSKASNENIKACIGMCLTDANEQRFKDYGTNLKDCLDWLEKQKKQKQEWSESDKQNINLIISYLDSYIKEHNDTFGADECKYLKYWLKSLPLNLKKKNEDIANLCSNEWNEEDEDTINLMIAILRENYSNCLFKTNSANTIRMSAISTDMLIKRIEALRPQPKQEWNDEDERKRDGVIHGFTSEDEEPEYYQHFDPDC